MKSIVATSVVILCSVALGADKETAKPTPEQKIRQEVVAQRKAKLKDRQAGLKEAKTKQEDQRELGEIGEIAKTIEQLELESQFWNGVADGSQLIPYAWLLTVDKKIEVKTVNSETEFVGEHRTRHGVDFSPHEILFVGWDTAGFEKEKKVDLPGYGLNFTRDGIDVVQRAPDEIITKPVKATKTQPKSETKIEKQAAKPTPEQKLRQEVVTQREEKLRDEKAALEYSKKKVVDDWDYGSLWKLGSLGEIAVTIEQLELESQFWVGVADGFQLIPYTWLLTVDKKIEVVTVNSETEFIGRHATTRYRQRRHDRQEHDVLFVGWDTAGFEKGEKVALPGYGLKFSRDGHHVVQRVPDEIISKPVKVTQTQLESEAKTEK